ncbi:hypothetical protein HNP70_001109 [Borreliella kurtenbachii]
MLIFGLTIQIFAIQDRIRKSVEDIASVIKYEN